MDSVKFTVYGDPAVLKNSKRIVRAGKKPKLVPSKRVVEWMDAAVDQLLAIKHESTGYPILAYCQASIVSYVADRRRRDLDNSLSAPLDAMVRAGIIGDDDQVKSLDGSRLRYDKTNPRVEITIMWPFVDEVAG
jgi:Holliday junction resolvase RusA-like endonuclease